MRGWRENGHAEALLRGASKAIQRRLDSLSGSDLLVLYDGMMAGSAAISGILNKPRAKPCHDALGLLTRENERLYFSAELIGIRARLMQPESGDEARSLAAIVIREGLAIDDWICVADGVRIARRAQPGVLG